MTLPSQFSLEEENFYKDIQDLVKKGSQNEKELSLFLERYMDLLAKADLDDETFIINFTKAGLIIEASTKVYGTKVDKLWVNLEHVLESLKNKGQGHGNKKKPECEDDGEEADLDGGCDDIQEGKKKLPNASKRKKKLGDTLFSSDDFFEIDNVSGLLGKCMNEKKNINASKIKLCEKVPNMFIKNKKKKKKMDVCLNKCVDDKDIIRLRDWIISADCLLVKEIYSPLPETSVLIRSSFGEDKMNVDASCNSESYKNSDGIAFDNLDAHSLHEDDVNSTFKDEKNNNLEIEQPCSKEAKLDEKHLLEEKNSIIQELNISRESDLAKFPNLLNRPSEGCLVDVDEVFWNPSKFQDVISTKKMRMGKSNKLPCHLCIDKKAHKKKDRRCSENKKVDCLDSYFIPHVQPTLTVPRLGNLPDQELYNAFKIETKLLEHLGRVDASKNINEAYHPDENPEELRNFFGFDEFENYLMKMQPELLKEDEISEDLPLDRLEDDNDNYVDDLLPDREFELPVPVTESSLKSNFVFEENDPDLNSTDFLAKSNSEYQKLVNEQLKDHYAAKSNFAKDKELGMKIAKWHEMIADKIKLSEKRGALNMNVLAGKIMEAFPPSEERPVMTFQDLVRKQSSRDVPRYFFACLQLTNEGNLDISKSDSKSLATDCMVITRLRTSRSNYDLEENSPIIPSREFNSSKTLSAQSKRKRDSLGHSPSILEAKDRNKKKKIKQRTGTLKRQNSFNSIKNSKRRKRSISSSDSVLSE